MGLMGVIGIGIISNNYIFNTFIFIVLIITLFLGYRYIRNRKKKSAVRENKFPISNQQQIYLSQNLLSVFIYISKYYTLVFNCLLDLNFDEIQELEAKIQLQNKDQEERWINLEKLIRGTTDESLDQSKKRIQSILHVSEVLKSIIKSVKKFTSKSQFLTLSHPIDLNSLTEEFSQFMNYSIHYLHTTKKSGLSDVNDNYQIMQKNLEKRRKRILKQSKKQEISTKDSLFYLQLLSDTENILFHLNKILNI